MTSNKDLNVPPLFVEFVNNFVQEYLEVLEQKRKHADERKRPHTSFTREIRCIMHSFGDCKKPLWDTVLYMEKILRQQMNLLLCKSSEAAHLRQGEFISHEDLLFLLRKNKVKLKRLLQYLNIKDAKEVLIKPTKLTDLVQNPESGKRVKQCLKFLTMIDNLFTYEDIFKEEISDPTMQFRNERKFVMVSSMSTEEYLDFTSTQQATFFPKGGDGEFTMWLLEDEVTNMTASPLALEIFNYLARETICEVIDLVMVLRKENNSGDPNILMSASQILIGESNTRKESSVIENKAAITVLEMQEALCRYAKISKSKELFCNENIDVLLSDTLLCC